MQAYIDKHNSEVIIRTNREGHAGEGKWGVMVNLKENSVSPPCAIGNLIDRNQYSEFKPADASNPHVQKALGLLKGK